MDNETNMACREEAVLLDIDVFLGAGNAHPIFGACGGGMELLVGGALEEVFPGQYKVECGDGGVFIIALDCTPGAPSTTVGGLDSNGVENDTRPERPMTQEEKRTVIAVLQNRFRGIVDVEPND